MYTVGLIIVPTTLNSVFFVQTSTRIKKKYHLQDTRTTPVLYCYCTQKVKMPETVDPAAIAKIRLAEFNEKSPELWFSTAEALFRSNKINDQNSRFPRLLQSLQVEHLARIESVIKDLNYRGKTIRRS